MRIGKSKPCGNAVEAMRELGIRKTIFISRIKRSGLTVD